MQGGRWSIHTRYSSTEHEDAIEDAKQVEHSGIGNVRVLRDVYDEDIGTSHEQVVYASFGMGGKDKRGNTPNAKPGSGGGGGVGGTAGYGDDDEYDFDGLDFDSGGSRGGGNLGFGVDDYDDDFGESAKSSKSRGKSKQKKPKKDSTTSIPILISKLLLILLGSIAVAVGVINVATPYLIGLNLFGTKLVGNTFENALIIIFLTIFTVCSLSMAHLLLRNTKLKGSGHRSRPASRQPTRKTVSPQSTQEQIDALADNLSEDLEETDAMDEFREEAANRDKADTDDAEDEDDESNKESEVEDKKSNPDSETELEQNLSHHGEMQKTYMVDYINKALVGAGLDPKTMSNFEKFGVSMFVAGSCEVLSAKKGLDENSAARIMADSVESLGFKKVHAKSFASKYEEYLIQDASYMQMYQAGRNAMNSYMEDNNSIPSNMKNAITSWNKPKKKETDSGPITVLFTDIAGSTAMTQQFGDAGAQEIVRAHNRIVREALTMYAGKEVKHTGDGIMASFTRTSDSIGASIQIQRETDQYTTATPEKPLHIKIGINAGEPIAEDNDLFGTTVQMSARIVDKAKADQIFVSEIVKGICAGKSFNFVNRGTYRMKGFDTDPILYEVMWREE